MCNLKVEYLAPAKLYMGSSYLKPVSYSVRAII